MKAHPSDGIEIRRLADVCCLSEGGFARVFKVSTASSPCQWAVRRRVDHAVEMMRQTDLGLSSIAAATGCSDQSHLGRVFTQRMGVTPAVWRGPIVQ